MISWLLGLECNYELSITNYINGNQSEALPTTVYLPFTSPMNLFNPEPNPNFNHLHKDGEVNYFGKIFSRAEANHFFETLLNTIEWKNDEAIIFGKRIITKRKVAWYGDAEYDYTYSNNTKKALPWTQDLITLKTNMSHNDSLNKPHYPTL